MGQTTRSGEKIVSDWSLAPPGVRNRAEELRSRRIPGALVHIVLLGSHALISAGAWVVTLSPAGGGRRRFVYAESDTGEVLGDWSYER